MASKGLRRTSQHYGIEWFKGPPQMVSGAYVSHRRENLILADHEAGVSRHDGDPIKAPPLKPSSFKGALNVASMMLRDARFSDSCIGGVVPIQQSQLVHKKESLVHRKGFA